MPDEFSQRVQKMAEAHLEACELALFDEDVNAPTPAVGWFCGCNTCIVREVLHVVWDEMLEEARREVRDE